MGEYKNQFMKKIILITGSNPRY